MTTPTLQTADTLATSTQARDKASAQLTEQELRFAGDPVEKNWAKVLAARADAELRERQFQVANANHDAAVSAEIQRVADEHEAARVAALQRNQEASAANDLAVRKAIATISKCYAKSWDLLNEEQSLGGPGQNNFKHLLSVALAESLQTAGLSPGMLKIS